MVPFCFLRAHSAHTLAQLVISCSELSNLGETFPIGILLFLPLCFHEVRFQSVAVVNLFYKSATYSHVQCMMNPLVILQKIKLFTVHTFRMK